ncbi:MAG: hypothetical protein AAGF12_36520 [Myxococcota bacterium]
MRIHWLYSTSAALGMFILPQGCASDDDCPSTSALQASLDAAGPGGTVTLGSCTVAGPLRVPAGVTLTGGGEAVTVIQSTSGTAVRVEAGAGTGLSQLSVESDGCAAVVATGSGPVELRSLDVRASTGVGLAVEGVTTLTIEDVDVIGPVTAATADDTMPSLPPFRCGTSTLATHGIVLVDVADARVTNTTVDGFSAFGVLALRSTTTWMGGRSSNHLGTAFEVWDGSATVNALTVRNTSDGAGAVESFGVVFGGGATVTTADLMVEDGDAFGVFHDGATVTHQSLVARNNGFAGVWAQNSDDLQILGTSRIVDNAFAGVTTIGSRRVELDGAEVTGTTEGIRIDGVRTVRAGDGVHFIDSQGALRNLTMANNERVGALFDLGGGSTSDFAADNLMIDGSGTALGAIVQNGTIMPGWDASVQRLGATLANDMAFLGALDIAGAVGPVCFPPLDQVETAGIGPLLMR